MLRTDGEGAFVELQTDGGRTWAIERLVPADTLTTDSVYRAVCTYSAPDAGTSSLKVYAYTLPLSMEPTENPRLKDSLKTDPVHVQSIWRSGTWLNLILQPMVKDRPHYFHFIDSGLEQRAQYRLWHITLYHDRNGDVEGFRRRVYASIPLTKYAHRMTKGDSIRLHIHTYTEGMTERTYPY